MSSSRLLLLALPTPPPATSAGSWPASVHEPAGQPFHRPHGEVAEPRGGRQQLERPDCHAHRELAGPIHSAEETKAVAVEDRGADHRLQQVVGEGHASHGRHRSKLPAALTEQHHEGHPAKRHEEIAPVVQLLADEDEVQEVPPRRVAPPESERDQHNTGPESEDRHTQIEGPGAGRTEDTQLEQRHADQHEARYLPEELGDEGHGLRLQRRRHPLRHLLGPPPAVLGDLEIDDRGPRRPLRSPGRQRDRVGLCGRPGERERQCRAGSEDQAAQDQEPSGREPAGEKTTVPVRAKGTSMSPYHRRYACRRPRASSAAIRLMWARQAGMARGPHAGACMTILTPSNMAKIVMNLPSASRRRGEPRPPVDALEVTIGRRVPAGQAGEREELDVGGEHAEHAYPPEHVQGPDPRRYLAHDRLGHAVTLSRRPLRGPRVFAASVTASWTQRPCDCSILWTCCRRFSSLILGPPGASRMTRIGPSGASARLR